MQQQQQDTALTIEHDTLSAHHRAAGQAYFDSVVAKAKQGADPFAAEPPKKGSSTAAVVEDLHPDVAAFGAALERHKGLLLATALVVSQAFSWVLMKVSGLAHIRGAYKVVFVYQWHYNSGCDSLILQLQPLRNSAMHLAAASASPPASPSAYSSASAAYSSSSSNSSSSSSSNSSIHRRFLQQPQSQDQHWSGTTRLIGQDGVE
jgi:hypothetical protein